MSDQDRTYGAVATSSNGLLVQFVARSDAGGEMALWIKCPLGSHPPIPVVFDRYAAVEFERLTEEARADAFG